MRLCLLFRASLVLFYHHWKTNLVPTTAQFTCLQVQHAIAKIKLLNATEEGSLKVKRG